MTRKIISVSVNGRPDVSVAIKQADAFIKQKKFKEIIALLGPLRKSPGMTAHALNLLSVAHYQMKNTKMSFECIQEALKIDPNFAPSLMNYGVLMQSQQKHGEAAKAFEKIIKLDPKNVNGLTNLSAAYEKLGRFEEMVPLCKRALEINPKNVNALVNLAVSYTCQNDPDMSAKYYKEALKHDPDNVFVTHGYSLSLLKGLHYDVAWEHHEKRIDKKDTKLILRTLDPKTRWQGQNIKGKRLFVQNEQGMGDWIMMMRYLPEVIKRSGARVVLEIMPPLHPLFIELPGVEFCVRPHQNYNEFDYHVLPMSFPYLLGTDDIKKIPQKPYIKANKSLVKKWEPWFKAAKDKLKVGIVWAGNNRHSREALRSVKKELLEKILFDLENVQFYSLQLPHQGVENTVLNGKENILNLAPHMCDFAESAAALTHLDLVISVDSAPIHLAGSMGVPAWLFCYTPYEWRWGVEGRQAPWYKSVEIFRQEKGGDWTPTLKEMRSRLEHLAQEKKAPKTTKKSAAKKAPAKKGAPKKKATAKKDKKKNADKPCEKKAPKKGHAAPLNLTQPTAPPAL